jgi:phage terminase small subunit
LSAEGDKELLPFLKGIIDDDLKNILASSDKGELNKYCEQYQGFLLSYEVSRAIVTLK